MQCQRAPQGHARVRGGVRQTGDKRGAESTVREAGAEGRLASTDIRTGGKRKRKRRRGDRMTKRGFIERNKQQSHKHIEVCTASRQQQTVEQT